MIEVTFPRATPFEGCGGPMTREAALKVLEEAAELVEAVKDYRAALGRSDYEERFGKGIGHYEERVLAEVMDVYQTLANLLAGRFTDDEIARAYRVCVERNRDRGRL